MTLAGPPRSLPIVTFDVRLGAAARALGFGVIGA
jgi:hypothetical protein